MPESVAVVLLSANIDKLYEGLSSVSITKGARLSIACLRGVTDEDLDALIISDFDWTDEEEAAFYCLYPLLRQF